MHTFDVFFGVDRETANMMIYFYYFRSYREVFFGSGNYIRLCVLLLRLSDG